MDSGMMAHFQQLARKQNLEVIPTWEVGVAQGRPEDYANLLREGYTRHAVIHASASWIAANASVVPMLVTVKGEPVDRHPLLEFLANPNDWQSGQEYRQDLLTHELLAGNAYEAFERARGLIRSVALLRPDRVEIKPGRKRMDDMFVYTVGTSEHAFPQPDVIHHKLPNPTNDYYGLAPPEPVLREANLDIDMTLFAKAFFENAGVPFGLLTVQAMSKEQREDAKVAWQRAFNRTVKGVRKFFELLILNADEAKYQEIGKAPDGLAMSEMRHHVEARICSAYKLPPVIIGQMVGLQFSTYSNFETAEKVAWRYGIAYYLERMRARWQKELVPEFRRSNEPDLAIAYDLSRVPALAEDNTEKLKAVAVLVDGGGFTPNQALALVGLPIMEGGDFYVRKLTSSIETLALPRGTNGRVPKALPPVILDAKDSRSLFKLGDVIRVVRDRVIEKAIPPLRDFFDEQAAAVADAIERLPKATIREGDIFPPGQHEALRFTLNAYYLELDAALYQVLAESLSLPGAYDASGAVTQRIMLRAAERIVAINETTKAAIRAELLRAEAEGLNVFQLSENLRGIVAETYKNRAETVARTEMSFATNDATLGRYREAGVEEVDIIDGTIDECCAARNGTRVPVSSGPDLCHPNCTLTLIPVVTR